VINTGAWREKQRRGVQTKLLIKEAVQLLASVSHNKQKQINPKPLYSKARTKPNESINLFNPQSFLVAFLRLLLLLPSVRALRRSIFFRRLLPVPPPLADGSCRRPARLPRVSEQRRDWIPRAIRGRRAQQEAGLSLSLCVDWNFVESLFQILMHCDEFQTNNWRRKKKKITLFLAGSYSIKLLF